MRNLAKGEELRSAIAAEDLPIEIRSLDVCDPASVSRSDRRSDRSRRRGQQRRLRGRRRGRDGRRRPPRPTVRHERGRPAARHPRRAAGVAGTRQRHDRQRVEHRRHRRCAVRRGVRRVEARHRSAERGVALRDKRLRHPGPARRARSLRHRIPRQHRHRARLGGLGVPAARSDRFRYSQGVLSGDGPRPTRRTSPMPSSPRRSIPTRPSVSSSATTRSSSRRSSPRCRSRSSRPPCARPSTGTTDRSVGSGSAHTVTRSWPHSARIVTRCAPSR